MSDESLEMQAALLRLGVDDNNKVSGSRRRRKLRRILAHQKRQATNHRLMDEKQVEQKVGTCLHCRQEVWLDLYGEQWKANGDPICRKAPFMSHEVPDD